MTEPHIRVECPRCGDVRLPVEAFAIYSFPSPEALHGYGYSFKCQFCEQTRHKVCTSRIYDMLGAENVTAYVLYYPKELGEQHPHGLLRMVDIRAAVVEMDADDFNAEKARY